MKNKMGFTILEIAVVMAILGTVFVGLATSMAYFFQSYTFSYEEYQAIGIAQSTLTRMVRDIRESTTGENGAWPLINASDNSFSFYSDVTGDGKTDLVRYFLDGTDLKRGVIEPSGSPVTYPVTNEKITIVASYVANNTMPLFTYYNGNWPGDTVNNPLILANRTVQSRYITVHVKIDTKPSTQTGGYELTSGVEIRSLKDNL